MSKPNLTIKFDLPTDRQIAELLDLAKKFDQYKVLDKAVTVAANPIVRQARQDAPDGKKSGNSQKRSRAQIAGIKGPRTVDFPGKKWQSERRDKEGKIIKINWHIPLKSTIDRKIRKYQYSALAVIGPKRPEGNKVYFNVSKNGRDEWWWGTNKKRKYAAVHNFITAAFDKTRSEQLSKMRTKLRELIDKLMVIP